MANTFSNLKKRIAKKIYERVKPPNLRGYYSQFGEDTALQTYFINKLWDETREYEVKQNGFYVDIGAFSPIIISNTYWFYQHGWRGINVEPFPEVIKKFDKERPRDINVSVAIGLSPGLHKYYSWGHSNMNTFSAEQAASYMREGKVAGEPAVFEIEVIRMDTFLDRYLPANVEIDFLSVDVEGMDLEVLSSNDWEKYRPELVAVELHYADISEVISSDLYCLMLAMGYRLYYWLSPALIFVDGRNK
jgi:FkbM family methyltransferase